MKRLEKRRIRLSNLRFLNIEPNILLHVRFKSSEMRVVCFEMIDSVEPVRSKDNLRATGKKGTVLVDVIKFVDSPERIISVFVWFDPVDFFYSLGLIPLTFLALSASYLVRVSAMGNSICLSSLSVRVGQPIKASCCAR
jgi:hypothetical protein